MAFMEKATPINVKDDVPVRVVLQTNVKAKSGNSYSRALVEFEDFSKILLLNDLEFNTLRKSGKFEIQDLKNS